jgi:glutamate formiminotransferase/formiminotetrahydrofolate cyclodeaminase
MQTGDVASPALAEVLEGFARDGPAPGGGAAAAIVAALASAVVAKAAQASRASWAEAGGAVAQATLLRKRCVRLAEEDAGAFTAALSALETQAAGLVEQLDYAAEVPVRIAASAADVAELAAAAAERCEGAFRADAASAAMLAEAAARAAARLVEVNLTVTADDPRLVQAQRSVASASASAARALDAGR